MDWPILADAPGGGCGRRCSRLRADAASGRGEVVFHAGDPGEALHLIHKGRFAVRAMTPRGEAAILTIFGPGEAFGEMALLAADHERSATVEALEPGETLQRRPGRVPATPGAAPRRDDGGCGDPHAPRVAAVAASAGGALSGFRRAGTVGGGGTRGPVLLRCRIAGGVVPLTQEQIAEFAGSSRATVNRVLREEQEHRVVRLERGRVDDARRGGPASFRARILNALRRECRPR